MTSRLTASSVTLGYGDRNVVTELDLEIPAGRVSAIVGPNGCGKTTLIRALGRLLQPRSGRVLLDGEDINRLDSRQVARAISILPQTPAAPEGLIVRDLVARGRYPHRSWLRRENAEDRDAVSEALARTGLDSLAHREIQHLSGGQRQRAWIAMALAQRPDILLLDEPTNHLDLVHQVEVLDLVGELRDEGATTVVVLHDLTLAARYADHLIVMCEGRIIAAGPPGEILTEDLLATAFSLNARIIREPRSGCPVVFPLGRTAPANPDIEGADHDNRP